MFLKLKSHFEKEHHSVIALYSDDEWNIFQIILKFINKKIKDFKQS